MQRGRGVPAHVVPEWIWTRLENCPWLTQSAARNLVNELQGPDIKPISLTTYQRLAALRQWQAQRRALAAAVPAVTPHVAAVSATPPVHAGAAQTHGDDAAAELSPPQEDDNDFSVRNDASFSPGVGPSDEAETMDTEDAQAQSPPPSEHTDDRESLAGAEPAIDTIFAQIAQTLSSQQRDADQRVDQPPDGSGASVPEPCGTGCAGRFPEWVLEAVENQPGLSRNQATRCINNLLDDHAPGISISRVEYAELQSLRAAAKRPSPPDSAEPAGPAKAARAGPSDETRSPSDASGAPAWECGVAGCGCLAGKPWAEEVDEAGKTTLLFCARHFDGAERPSGWSPALTLQYGAASTRERSRVVAHAFRPGAEEAEGLRAKRALLTQLSEEYLEFKARCLKEIRPGTLNGGREVLFIYMEGREAGWKPPWTNEATSKPQRSKRRRRGKAAQLKARTAKAPPKVAVLSAEQQQELERRYDDITAVVRDIINAERDAGTLKLLMERLRPNVTVEKTVLPRAIELILASPHADAQYAHKDYVEASQAQVALRTRVGSGKLRRQYPCARAMQVQLYVNGAAHATRLVTFRGSATETQRVAYEATTGVQPTAEWAADANIVAELAAVCEADDDDLDTRSLSWGAVPAGQWQAIGDHGAVHYGPATDTLRVILVLVLTVENHEGWAPLQYAGPPALLTLSNAIGLVRAKVVKEVATRYLQNRCKEEGDEYETHFHRLGLLRRKYSDVAGRGDELDAEDLETPDAPDFVPWLQQLLAAVWADYTVGLWPPEYVWAFIAYVTHHAGITRGDVQMPEDYVRDFVDEDSNSRPHCRRVVRLPAEVGLWTHRWEPVFNPACAGTDECRCTTCIAVGADGYKPDATGVQEDKFGPFFVWRTNEQLKPDVKAEIFYVPPESEAGFVFVDKVGTKLEIRPGECGELCERFDGQIRWEKGKRVLKIYEYVSMYGEPHGNTVMCDECGLGCAAEHYRHTEAGGRDCSAMTVAQLQAVCRELRLKVSGLKDEVRARIQAWNAAHNLSNTLWLPSECRDLCRVCYLKKGPGWAIARAAGAQKVTRNRHETEQTFSDAEQGRIQHFLGEARKEAVKHAAMNAARDVALPVSDASV